MRDLASAAAGLAGAQNADGGWPYHPGGSSWTEPTAYAVLAQAAVAWAGRNASLHKAAGWLLANQRPDGGWPPHPKVAQSTWVTALVLMCLGPEAPELAVRRATGWLLESTGRETSLLHRLRSFLHGGSVSSGLEGWPWFPGSAAWVEPTALTVIGLRKAKRAADSTEVTERINMGIEFLLARRCRDSGWNHGSTRALGYDSDSYPESTGLALLALRGVNKQKVGTSLQTASRMIEGTVAGEARSWLELGLRAQGVTEIGLSGYTPRGAGTRANALWLLAAASREGSDVFA